MVLRRERGRSYLAMLRVPKAGGDLVRHVGQVPGEGFSGGPDLDWYYRMIETGNKVAGIIEGTGM
jgi:hypothetical protein